MKLFDIFLGIMSAIGGNVDIGQLVFTIAGGAKFGYLLLWVVVVATIGITVYAEMSGRVAVVTKEPAFALVREHLGLRVGLVMLVASTAVNVLTCAAEVGGIGVVLQLLFGGDDKLMMIGGTLALLCAIAFLKFEHLDQLFGLLGLGLVVYAVVAIKGGPDWSRVAMGLVPRLPEAGMPDVTVYAYYAVGLFSAILMPYEVHFYSSGAIEEKWTVKDLPSNYSNAVMGFTLGGVLTLALIVVGAVAFHGKGIDPHTLGTTALPVAMVLGPVALTIALVGMLFAVSGAAAETALACAYSLGQFWQWPWGKDKKRREAPKFHASWAAAIVGGMFLNLTGVEPLDLVQYSVVFAVVVLPFTYYPILRVADDRAAMGRHANGPIVKWLGWIFLGLITLAAIAAVPLMLITHNGEG